MKFETLRIAPRWSVVEARLVVKENLYLLGLSMQMRCWNVVLLMCVPKYWLLKSTVWKTSWQLKKRNWSKHQASSIHYLNVLCYPENLKCRNNDEGDEVLRKVSGCYRMAIDKDKQNYIMHHIITSPLLSCTS
ncbi:hypothetical protein F2Q68_00031730 [Brassica cretica]|uniref:Uncharacterized protein n=1 Tax=Brassica cretica TaxID=69181 RepID=A0A8S9GFI2_BRACR|nr:hypothetical protein F2Q68_00031730 [Brassica cretica]